MSIFVQIKMKLDETDSKQSKIYRKINTSRWILKISRKKIRKPKVSWHLPNVCDF